MLALVLMMATAYAATSPYGTLFGFNLTKVNIDNQEAPLKAIDVNGQLYVPIQMYVQEMNGSYAYDMQNFTVHIVRGKTNTGTVGTGTVVSNGTSTNTNYGGTSGYNPNDPYGYYSSGTYNPASEPTGYGTNSQGNGYGYQTGTNATGYQNYRSPFYDPRYDNEILYDIIPYRSSSERYHIGFIQLDMESFEAFLDEVERTSDEFDAVFESAISPHNKDMTLEEAERRFEVRKNTYRILEDRFKDMLEEVEDLKKSSQPYENELEDAIDELDEAMEDMEDALKELEDYMNGKKRIDRDKFRSEQEQAMDHLNDADEYFGQAEDGIEEALDEIE